MICLYLYKYVGPASSRRLAATATLPHLHQSGTATPPPVRQTKPQPRLHPAADLLNCRVNGYTEKQHLLPTNLEEMEVEETFLNLYL